MTDFLAEPPWYLPVLLALAAITLLAQGNMRLNRRLKSAGLVVSLLAVTVALLAYFLESGREKAIRLTREVAVAVDDRNWKSFSALLDPKVRFAPIYNGRDELVAGATVSADRVGVKNIALSGFETLPEPGGFTVTFLATADLSIGGGQRVPTNWRFFWSREGDAMLLYRIEVLAGQQIGNEAVISRLVKPN